MDDDGVAPDSGIQSYAYFFRESCPNCTPVKSYVENLTIDGRMVNVDTGEGMAQAIEHQILSTPTVLLMNDRGETVAQAGNVDQLRTIIESAS
jgi:glutaredoxin